MITKVQKWGNSQAVRLTRRVLDDLGLDVGDELEVDVKDGAITLRPSRPIRGRYDLDELMAHVPADYKPEEVNWGEPAGREVW